MIDGKFFYQTDNMESIVAKFNMKLKMAKGRVWGGFVQTHPNLTS